MRYKVSLRVVKVKNPLLSKPRQAVVEAVMKKAASLNKSRDHKASGQYRE